MYTVWNVDKHKITFTLDINYVLITNLMHWLLYIHKILFSSTSFEPQVLIFRRIQLYTCSIWYRHTLWDSLWWPVGTQLELELTVLTQAVYRQATTSSRTVTVLYAACVQLYPPEDEHLMLETCRGE